MKDYIIKGSMRGIYITLAVFGIGCAVVGIGTWVLLAKFIFGV